MLTVQSLLGLSRHLGERLRGGKPRILTDSLVPCQKGDPVFLFFSNLTVFRSIDWCLDILAMYYLIKQNRRQEDGEKR